MAVKPKVGCVCCGNRDPQWTPKGLRDYSRWLDIESNPRVGASDVDMCMSRPDGAVVALEEKVAGAPVPQGQRLLLKHMVRKGITVLVAWLDSDLETVRIALMTKHGTLPNAKSMSLAELNRCFNQWFTEGAEWKDLLA